MAVPEAHLLALMTELQENMVANCAVVGQVVTSFQTAAIQVGYWKIQNAHNLRHLVLIKFHFCNAQNKYLAKERGSRTHQGRCTPLTRFEV